MLSRYQSYHPPLTVIHRMSCWQFILLRFLLHPSELQAEREYLNYRSSDSHGCARLQPAPKLDGGKNILTVARYYWKRETTNVIQTYLSVYRFISTPRRTMAENRCKSLENLLPFAPANLSRTKLPTQLETHRRELHRECRYSFLLASQIMSITRWNGHALAIPH